MKRDLDRHREWQERSRRKAAEKQKEQGRARLPPENKKRRALRRATAFAGQAEWCRHHLCAACFPHLYTDEFLAQEHPQHERVSDPHHTVAGHNRKDEHNIPLCRTHHDRCSAVGSSERDVQVACGLNFRAVAALIHRNISGNVEHI
jgi:hypothetical protein